MLASLLIHSTLPSLLQSLESSNSMGKSTRLWTGTLGASLFCFLFLHTHAQKDADVVLVLAGGVNHKGNPHETVRRRLDAALQLHRDAAQRGQRLPIVCNGGGTTHKPKFVDNSGYSVPEAALMARYLVDNGVDSNDIFLEGHSDDTLGNAFFARVMHVDVRPDWTNIIVITSEFQMARTRAIYDWVFSLSPLPAGKASYRLHYQSVSDSGALSYRALSSRVAKEKQSLLGFQSGLIVKMGTMREAHNFMFTRHSAYSPVGVLSKKRMNLTSSMVDSY